MSQKIGSDQSYNESNSERNEEDDNGKVYLKSYKALRFLDPHQWRLQ